MTRCNEQFLNGQTIAREYLSKTPLLQGESLELLIKENEDARSILTGFMPGKDGVRQLLASLNLSNHNHRSPLSNYGDCIRLPSIRNTNCRWWLKSDLADMIRFACLAELFSLSALLDDRYKLDSYIAGLDGKIYAISYRHKDNKNSPVIICEDGRRWKLPVNQDHTYFFGATITGLPVTRFSGEEWERFINFGDTELMTKCRSCAGSISLTETEGELYFQPGNSHYEEKGYYYEDSEQLNRWPEGITKGIPAYVEDDKITLLIGKAAPLVDEDGFRIPTRNLVVIESIPNCPYAAGELLLRELDQIV